MPLNPLRDALQRAGRRAVEAETPFRRSADVALGDFRSRRSALEKGVREGDLTPKVAREQAVLAAEALKQRLLRESDGYSPVPRVFRDRLVSAAVDRRKARESASLETLQRETNRLLRKTLVEGQIQTRAPEFEGRAFVRSMTGGPPAPTIDGLLAFHEEARISGDEAAQEWARRSLETLRPRTIDSDEIDRIDRACDRPDRFNARIVERYVEALRESAPESLEEFVDQAIDARDTNACCAAFLLARQALEGLALRWVRRVVDGLARFPDPALEALGAEAEARRADAEAARASAEYAIALADAEARLSGVEAPSPADLARRERHRSLPVAAADEPIGLRLQKRGRMEHDPISEEEAADEAV